MSTADAYVREIIAACGRIRGLIISMSLVCAVLLAVSYVSLFSSDVAERTNAAGLKVRLEGYLKTESDPVQIAMMRAEIARLQKLLEASETQPTKLPVIGIDLSPSNMNVLGGFLLVVLCFWLSISLRQVTNAIRIPTMKRDVSAYMPAIRLAVDTIVGDIHSARAPVPVVILIFLPFVTVTLIALLEFLFESSPLYLHQRHDPLLDFLHFRDRSYLCTLGLLCVVLGSLGYRLLRLRGKLIQALRGD